MLWNSRFEKELDKKAFDFSNSFGFDIELLEEDIEQNIAHSKMLNEIGIVSDKELENILVGLNKVKNLLAQRHYGEYEDIHSAIELELRKLIGETADKIHTGRSRNDQVATIIRMWSKKKISELKEALSKLQNTLILLAEENINTVIPGYTHLQRAQPVSFAHHLLAYVEMLERDKLRLCNCFSEADSSPLGCGALAGSTLPLNRIFVMKELGFAKLCNNSMDAVSDRDFLLDFLNCCSIGMMHLSRLSEEIIIWNSAEWNFVTLDDAHSTGSSLMPQKKNPDIPELIRGKTGRIFGNQFSLLTVMKGLPLTYNRDLQEDKEPVFDSYFQYLNSLLLLADLLSSIKINKERFTDELNGDYAFATDFVDWLVLKGVAFRKAHSIVGTLVKYAVNNNKKLNELSLEEFKNISPLFDETVLHIADINRCLKSKKTLGSPNPDLIKKQIAKLKKNSSIA